MNNCVIYARFSSYGQNEQSIEAQTRICKEFAENKGLNVIKLYSDKAKTGTNDDRPAFQRMIKDSSSGAFQYIIVYMFDRFARNRRDSIMYKEMLKESGIKVISALEPVADDEGGEFYEMFLEWNAEKYSKRLSKRVRDGLDTSVGNGTFCGGHLIYGYDIEQVPIGGKTNKFIKKVVINEEEAKLVRYVFEQYDKGVTRKQIADEFNQKGYLYKDKPFTQKPMENWLKNKKYTGEFNFGGRLCDNMYSAIISKELFESVQKRLGANRYKLGGQETARVPYLLTGKLFCGHCGTAMVSDGGTSKTGTTHLYYTCKKKKKQQCEKRREDKDNLEYYVTSYVVDFLSDSKNADMVIADSLKYSALQASEQNLKSIISQIANTKQKIVDLTNAFVYEKNDIMRAIETQVDEYDKLMQDLEIQKSKLELARDCKPTKEDLLEYLKIILGGDKTSMEYQKHIIDNLVFQVVVNDDNTLVFLNINKDKNTTFFPADEISDAVKEDTKQRSKAVNTTKTVRTQPVSPRQVRP